MSEQAYAGTLAQISDKLTRALAALDRIERNQTDPEENRQAIADITAGYVLTAQLAELAGIQRTEILEIVSWMRERLSGDELRQQFDDVLFQTKQLGSISQRWRDDLLLMRSDIRRLASAVELAISQLPTDERPSALPDDIRAVLESRRNGRQRLNAIIAVLLGAASDADLTALIAELEASDAATVAALRRAVGENAHGPDR